MADLTKKAGIHEYVLKMYVSGLPVAEKRFKVFVIEPQYRLLVAWDDASGDRNVDVGELVTFTVYIDWSFVPNATTADLYVDDGGGERLVKSISVAPYSGTAQATWQTVFNEAGVKTVRFVLKDPSGRVLAEKVVTFSVGEQKTQASAIPFDENTLKYVAVALLLLAAIYIVARRR